jgi:hypothetical protein
MLDQLTIGEKSSIDDFDASLKTLWIEKPKKKKIKDTVPFSNITHDFSKINGEIYWEEGKIECVFEIIADSPEELEQKKTEFSAWVMNVMDEKIFSPYDPDYYFLATYDDMKFEDEDSLDKTTATVDFSAYPYKIATYMKSKKIALTSGVEQSAIITNNSAHRIAPTIETNANCNITFGGISYGLTAGKWEDVIFLKVGANTITLRSETDCNVTITFSEEMFL